MDQKAPRFVLKRLAGFFHFVFASVFTLFLACLFFCFIKKHRNYADLSVLISENDFAGFGVKLVHNGEGFKANAFAADDVAAGLEALFNGNTDSLNGGACVFCKVDKTLKGFAVGKKIVDDENMVVGTEVFFAYEHIVNALFGE